MHVKLMELDSCFLCLSEGLYGITQRNSHIQFHEFSACNSEKPRLGQRWHWEKFQRDDMPAFMTSLNSTIHLEGLDGMLERQP